uniref:Myb/SANT-like DNA-binding domain-containing protein n=1 Tax=Amphilophus citrinellus TaxID=61819 RepID=A0A3Q0T1H8_AMPCI
IESGLGGRHWTDDEVRALLCVWADRSIRERLKCTLRNKSIFQEMARQMQRNFGVIRNWKQCRTKYKNLKYDYKTAKSAHAAGGSGRLYDGEMEDKTCTSDSDLSVTLDATSNSESKLHKVKEHQLDQDHMLMSELIIYSFNHDLA